MRKIINDGIEASTRKSQACSLMLGKPRIRQNNLKTSLRFPCLGLNPIMILLIMYYFSDGGGGVTFVEF